MSFIPIEGFYAESQPVPRRSAVQVMRGWVGSFIMPAEAPLHMSEHVIVQNDAQVDAVQAIEVQV